MKSEAIKLISDKTDFKPKNVTTYKERHFGMR